MQPIRAAGKKQVFHFFQYRDFPVRRFFENPGTGKKRQKVKNKPIWRRAKNVFEKIPGTGFRKILLLEENIRHFLTHFLGLFLVFSCPY